MQSDRGMYGIPRRAEGGPDFIYVNSPASFGSGTVGCIPIFSVLVDKQGSSITYITDPVLGDRFVINADGKYSMTFSVGYTSSSDFAITRNEIATDYSIGSYSIPSIRTLMKSYTANALPSSMTVDAYLYAGDIIRGHCSGASLSSADATTMGFRITKID